MSLAVATTHVEYGPDRLPSFNDAIESVQDGDARLYLRRATETSPQRIFTIFGREITAAQCEAIWGIAKAGLVEIFDEYNIDDLLDEPGLPSYRSLTVSNDIYVW